jgi:hypothetical protein
LRYGIRRDLLLVALDRNARPLSVSPTDAPERDVIV